MLSILSKEQAPLGSDYYRDNSVAVPHALKPTLKHTVQSNADGSNHNVTVRSDDNVVVEIDGRQVATDSFIMITKFTALQAVTATTERGRIFDAHLAYLTANRSAFIEGYLPDEPYVAS